MASKNDRDFDLDIKNHYRVEAGQDSPYGSVSYRVITNGGSGFGFHEDGVNRENLQCAVTGRSTEVLGTDIEEKEMQLKIQLSLQNLLNVLMGISS